MTSAQKERLAALELRGWRLTIAPSTDDRHAHSRVTPEFTLERLWNGRPVREPGRDLDHALECAEWQENRIASLDNRPVQNHEGLDSTDNNPPTGGHDA